MSKNKHVTVLTNLVRNILALVALGGFTTAWAVPNPPASYPVCFGSIGLVATAGPFVDLNGTPGLEMIVPHRTVVLDADTDADFLATSTTTYIINYHDETGALVWQRTGLGIASNEVMTALPGLDVLNVGTTFTPPTELAAFYPLPYVCEGVGVAEVGGEKYILLSAGASAAEGTPESGTDLSKIRLWVLDRTNGDIVMTHTLTGAVGQFLVAQNSGVMDINGDGDDELVVVRAEPRAPLGDKQRVYFHTETINLLTGASEGITTVNYSIAFTNLNNP